MAAASINAPVPFVASVLFVRYARGGRMSSPERNYFEAIHQSALLALINRRGVMGTGCDDIGRTGGGDPCLHDADEHTINDG